MRNPLDNVFVTQPFGVKAVAGTGLPDSNGVKRHLGTDLRASAGTQFFAPGAGKVNELYTGSKGIIVLGAEIEGMWHRFLHIKDSVVQVGQSFPEGALLGHTGNTGEVAAHLHWDVRKPNTLWNASLNNYVDPLSLIKGGDMISSDALDRLIKGMTGRDTTPDELNNPVYHNDPEKAILTFWENGGKQRFGDRLPEDQRYMIVRMGFRREPTPDQVSNEAWANTANGVTAVWNSAGKDFYYAEHNPDGSPKPQPTQGFKEVGTINGVPVYEKE